VAVSALRNMKPNDAKQIAALLREKAMNYKELCELLSKVNGETKRLKPLIGNPSWESKDSWLIRAGVALILLPDPTITDLIGASMVAVGMLKNRTQHSTLADVCKEFQEVARKVRSISQELKY